MGSVQHDELVLVRGRGCTLTTVSGAELIDAAGGLWYCTAGHGREEIVQAYAGQGMALESCSCFEDVCNQPALDLAERVAKLVPVDDPRIFFTSGGSDAVDTAAKLARRYWAEVGKPEKLTIISRDGSYHGMHAFGTSLAGIAANREGVGPLVREVARVPRFDAQALADTIDEIGPENVAAFFAEPVINAGVWAPPDDYLASARAVCTERDVLFVADEVVTGFGRLGRWFGSERYGIRPDMLLFAKGITSGYLPLGGVAVSGRIAEPFWSHEDAPMFRHGYTYSGHATVCAAGLANLDVLERESLPQRAAALEPDFARILTALADEPGIGDVRTTGLAAAVQLDPQRVAMDPSFPRQATLAIREHGVLSRMLSGFAFQISPPLIVTVDELERIADGIRAGLRDVLATRTSTLVS
jgi:adenosylmethionine-8-amino-7-oxononanoate aminotransferase